MADWRSRVHTNGGQSWGQPQYQYANDESTEDADRLDPHESHQVYNPLRSDFQTHQNQQQPQQQQQQQQQQPPSRGQRASRIEDASEPGYFRLHIDDLRASPMDGFIRLDLNSNQPVPSSSGGGGGPQVASSTETIVLDPKRPSFVDQLVSGIWTPQEINLPNEELRQQQQQQIPQGRPQSGQRTFEDTLPRTSLLVSREYSPSLAAFDVGRRTLDPEEYMDLEQPREQRNSMKNLSEFRPISDPSAAAGPALPGTRNGGRPRGVSTASGSSRAQAALRNDPNGTFRSTTVERARQIFASKQVRLQDSWHTDMWIYMKNAHPFIGTIGAHRWHPYKHRDRVLVLLVALYDGRCQSRVADERALFLFPVVTFVCCGVFATRQCCTTVLDVPIAVVDRRLKAVGGGGIAQTARALSRTPAGNAPQCVPFHGDCSGADAMCTQGSACESVLSGTPQKQCIPTVTVSQACSTLSCPSGWTCAEATHTCAPSSDLVCYLPRTWSSPAMSFAANTDGGNDDSEGGDGMTAIEAIFGILVIANENATSSSSTESAAHSGSGVGSGGSSTSPSVVIDPSSSASKDTAVSQKSVSVALTKPSNGEVYSVSSTIPVEWEVAAISGGDQPLQSFTVEFSVDGTAFTTIATEVTAASSETRDSEERSVFHFDWRLDGEEDGVVCTKCVLRVCAIIMDSASDLCIRSDGGGEPSTSTLVTAASAPRKGITFRIVREILACSCGVSHASFVQFSYVIALCIPFTVLLLEQLVTFYEYSKVFGCFARRGSPAVPLLCFYGHGATRIGRVLVVAVLAAACVGSGFQVARVNSDNFYNQKGRVVLLWLVVYALAIVLGFIYCSMLYLAIFSMRWKLEAQQKRQVGPLSDFNLILASSSSDLRQQHSAGGIEPM